MLRLYDNTRLSDFKRCPRYYMFRHELNWVVKGHSTALIFGGAWHAAQEVIWAGFASHVPPRELARSAYGAFLEYWCGNGMPAPTDMDYEMEKELSPRTPGRALEMIVAYIDKRYSSSDDFELIAIEKPFIVPLDPNDDTLFYIGKIDKIVKRRGKVLGIEHKTTTAYKKTGPGGGAPFRGGFVDSFSPNSQVDGYAYALHMIYPGEVGGIWVDAALVHKHEEGFLFIPVDRKMEQLDAWLWEVRWWIKQVEREKGMLQDAISNSRHGVKEPYLAAFPKNTNSCWDFGSSCPYLDLCKAWPNPLNHGVPAGYVEERWDPLDHIKGLDQLREKTP